MTLFDLRDRDRDLDLDLGTHTGHTGIVFPCGLKSPARTHKVLSSSFYTFPLEVFPTGSSCSLCFDITRHAFPCARHSGA